jgi:large subunit ribosomal protein L35
MDNCVEITTVVMPKLKTRRAAAKRFRATGSGKKIFRRKAFKNHLLDHKSAERKRRRLSSIALVSEQDEKEVRLMLPYL